MLTARETRQLGAAFEIAWQQVAEDAATFAAWTAPWDEFLAHLRRRYPWCDKGYAAAYLTSLREVAGIAS
jgi:cytochrome b